MLPRPSRLSHLMPTAPRFSVIVPTYGRPAALLACLQALARLEWPRDEVEVVVVNDGGDPPAPLPPDLLESLTVRILEQPHRGPAAARNAGARAARGTILLFTDDDCRPRPDWLARLAECGAAAPGAMIGGAVQNALSHDPYAAATQAIASYAFDYRARYQGTKRFFTTNNLMVPADRFRALGGFDERFPTAAGEDYDFCARWQEAGWPAALASAAIVDHYHGHGLSSFWRQHFQYGRALLRVRTGMAARARRRLPSLEAPRYYAGLLTAPLRGREPAGRWRLAALVALSQAATVVGALLELVHRPPGRAGAPARGH